MPGISLGISYHTFINLELLLWFTSRSAENYLWEKIFSALHGMQNFPNQGLKLWPLNWKHEWGPLDHWGSPGMLAFKNITYRRWSSKSSRIHKQQFSKAENLRIITFPKHYVGLCSLSFEFFILCEELIGYIIFLPCKRNGVF